MASTVRMKALRTARPAESPGGIQTQPRKSVRVPSQSAIGEKSLATELRRTSGNAVGFRSQERRETLVPSQSAIGEIKMAGSSRRKASPTARPGHPVLILPLGTERVLFPSQSAIGEIKDGEHRTARGISWQCLNPATERRSVSQSKCDW
jgi:hypothetical protein